MRFSFRTSVMALMTGVTVLALSCPAPSPAASRAEIDRDARAALDKLCRENVMAQSLAEKARGILVFPGIVKAGFIVGAQGGNGALFKNGAPVAHYNTVAASYGLQAGVQEYGYAMFFMTDRALAYLDRSGGWEVGVGPSVVIVDKEAVAAFGKSMTTTTLKDDIYAFIFSQKGLMAGLGLQGSKITRIHPK